MDQSHSPCFASFLRTAYPTGFLSELKPMIQLAWPMMISDLCQFGLQPLATIFAGHLGKESLDAVGLCNTLYDIMGNFLSIGIASACETFFSQTFGSENKKAVGVQLQRGMIFFMMALAPTWAFMINTESILRLLGQDPEVARLSGKFMQLFLPGPLFMFMYVCLRSYLECQNMVIPNLVVAVAGVVTNIVLQYVFLYQFNFGVEGSALALDAAYLVMFLTILGYIYFSKVYKDTWDGFTWRCLLDWGGMAKLVIPGVLILCIEVWAFEITVLLAGTLGKTELGAQSIVLQIDMLFQMVPTGFLTASMVRVGTALGAGNPDKAKTGAHVAFTAMGFVGPVLCILLATLRFELSKLFTEDKDVIDLAAQLFPVVAFYIFFDCFTAVWRGVFDGAGKQFLGSIFMFISYYLIALPIGIPIMYLTPLRTVGLWWAFSGALVINCFVFSITVFKFFDWKKLSDEARERAGVEPMTESVESTSKDTVPSSEIQENETSPLIRKSSDVEAVPGGEESDNIRAVVCRRLVLLIVIFAILGTAVFFRVLIKLPPPMKDLRNATTTVAAATTILM